MNDFIAAWLGPENIRGLTIVANIIAACFIGPYLAFAATPDAGLRCPQAFFRLLHRIVLVIFSLALMNNAMVLLGTDRAPTGAAFGINILILLSTLISAARYHWWMGDIPNDSSWRHPNLTFRKSDRQAALDVVARKQASKS